MARRPLCAAVIVLVALVGCGKKQPPQIVRIIEPGPEVKVPVPTRITPPPELLAPVAAALPTFVAPTDAQASSALTPEGERVMRALIEALLSRLEAWRIWATAPE